MLSVPVDLGVDPRAVHLRQACRLGSRSARPGRRQPYPGLASLSSTGHLKLGGPFFFSVTAFGSATASYRECPRSGRSQRGDSGHPRADLATGWWPPTAASLPSVGTPVRGIDRQYPSRTRRWVGMAAAPTGSRLFTGGTRRRRSFALRERAFFGIDRRLLHLNVWWGWLPHPHRARLLAGGRRRWRLFLRGRCPGGVDRRHPGGPRWWGWLPPLLSAAADSSIFASKVRSAVSSVVAMAAAPDGRGYWLVASDGGISALGAHR